MDRAGARWNPVDALCTPLAFNSTLGDASISSWKLRLCEPGHIIVGPIEGLTSCRATKTVRRRRRSEVDSEEEPATSAEAAAAAALVGDFPCRGGLAAKLRASLPKLSFNVSLCTAWAVHPASEMRHDSSQSTASSPRLWSIAMPIGLASARSSEHSSSRLSVIPSSTSCRCAGARISLKDCSASGNASCAESSARASALHAVSTELLTAELATKRPCASKADEIPALFSQD